MSKLSPPVYPPLAKQARITGDVNLIVSVRQDGSIQSVVAASGHPLLKPAALTSAQQSLFDCRNCSQTATSFSMVYSFQLGPTVHCTAPEQRYPEVIQSQQLVTVLDQPIGTCDQAITRQKVRSVRCLYLWRCGLR
jgi:TonB family protein